MKRLFSWIGGLFRDERGIPSSKRFVGILSSIVLIITFSSIVFIDDLTEPSETFIDALTILAVGGLGFSSVDKFWTSKNSIKNFKDDQNDSPLDAHK